MADRNVFLENKLKTMDSVLQTCAAHKDARLRAEEDCEKFHRENQKIRKQLSKQKEIRTLLVSDNQKLKEELAEIGVKKATSRTDQVSSESS